MRIVEGTGEAAGGPLSAKGRFPVIIEGVETRLDRDRFDDGAGQAGPVELLRQAVGVGPGKAPGFVLLRDPGFQVYRGLPRNALATP